VRLRRARAVTLVALCATAMTSVGLPAIGLVFESRALWIALGIVGILGFATAQAGALYGAVTPWLADATRRRLLVGYGSAALLSVPLVAPVGAGEWETWAWIGGSIAGTAPLLLDRRRAVAAIALTLVVVCGVAWWNDGSLAAYALISVSVALTIAAMCTLPAWLLGLLADAQAGRTAQTRLAVAEERLRFARDVHDVLGHHLTVIALKGELGARLSHSDADRAAHEAADVRRLATTALAEVRQAVRGYRAVDLQDQIDAIEQVMRSCGIRCTVTRPAEALPAEMANVLAAVLREASTNVLRHSHARWCTVEVTREGSAVRLTVANDGAAGGGPDRNSSGLRGLAERLADVGGTLRTHEQDGVFRLEAAIGPAA
jgi:two-component system, NarL family, sensor histidine kinase DesK